MDCARQIWRGEGVRGLFRGLGVTVAREIPAFALYFASFEAMTRQPGQPVGTAHLMVAGGVAGVLSWTVTYPVDIIKSRLQVPLVSSLPFSFVALVSITTFHGVLFI